MASPVHFPEVNAVLNKPENMSDEECTPLPIMRTPKGECVSCWRFTEEEIAGINATGCAFVGVLSGHTQPPIWVHGAMPVQDGPEPAEAAAQDEDKQAA
ncbi:hypothetical protein [Hymenobacter sp. YC55]|uniref:hypothetical protein n=1 Tax=Hymenobacter sp. YC55 TaxID=3034019 RepID=UPI0023F6A3E6|nr:hypothetical protein [Hymenobacter sp. YC55]MDF7810712.1 hypothetical protein [Hymenobacter sp. YC55]